MRRSTIRFVAAAALAALTLAACSSSSKGASPNTTQTTTAATTTTAGATTTTAAPSGPKTVSLASTSLGQILVDGNGMTLYLDECGAVFFAEHPQRLFDLPGSEYPFECLVDEDTVVDRRVGDR